MRSRDRADSQIAQRIAATLANDNIKSAARATLIVETEEAIAAADEAATKAREQALDAIVSPDAVKGARGDGERSVHPRPAAHRAAAATSKSRRKNT